MYFQGVGMFLTRLIMEAYLLPKETVAFLAPAILYISVGVLKGSRFTIGKEISTSGILPQTSVVMR
jgi:hypothetical protein